jgi:DNA-binding transcriptional LysR family regulator
VFEHEFEPDPPPEDIEVVDVFTDPPRLLLPAAHPLADAPAVALCDLADDTWVRAHHGSAARLVDHVLAAAALRPPTMLAGHGDEPVETQAFIAAGHGVTVAHELNVLIHPRQIVSVAVVDDVPGRRVQAAVVRGQHAPLPRAVLGVLEELGARRASTRD